MKIMSLSLCFFPFLVFLTLTSTSTNTIAIANNINNNNTLIKETCNKCAQNDPNLTYDFCVTSLQSAPSGRCATTLRGLGLASVKLLRRNVTSTRRRVRELLRDKKWEPYVRACLEDCLDLYADAALTLNQTVVDYKAKRYDDVNIELSSVIDASVTCEDGFAEKDGVVSPLRKRNNDTFQLSAMGLSIVNMIKLDQY